MLYTTEQIAEMYSGKENNVTTYMITHTWIANGLKHIRGKGSGYLYKKEWVEEYLEGQAEEKKTKKNKLVIRKGKEKELNKKCFVI